MPKALDWWLSGTVNTDMTTTLILASACHIYSSTCVQEPDSTGLRKTAKSALRQRDPQDQCLLIYHHYFISVLFDVLETAAILLLSHTQKKNVSSPAVKVAISSLVLLWWRLESRWKTCRRRCLGLNCTFTSVSVIANMKTLRLVYSWSFC